MTPPGMASVPNGRAMPTATSTPSVDGRESLGPIQESRITPPHPSQSRQASTSGMDALADLASMQHQQATRQNAAGMRDPQIFQAQRPAMSLQNIARSISGGSAKDVGMSDVPTKPHIYTANSLSQADCQAITDLAQGLAENSYDYESHVRIITLLHNGFVDHVHPPESHETTNDPFTYELLPDLLAAYKAMDNIYPVGEQLWLYWIEDEKMLAKSIEDRASVVELCRKATQDEPGSSSLWRIYGDYMYLLFTCAYELDAPERWPEEDKMIGKDVFKWDDMMAVWDRGIAATQGRMNDSNIVWDRYMEIMLQDQARWPSPEKVRNIRNLFEKRLVQPHATWNETSAMFSQFITTYYEQAYEEIMIAVNQRAAQSKKQYSLREPFELNIEKAVLNNDKAAEWYAFTEYLDWERRKQGVFSFNRIHALFERATLRFPTVPSLWEDYVEFLIQNPTSTIPLLPVLERATRHCPWSGGLWSHRILTLEAEAKDFQEIEHVKHSATETGLLDVGGLEELLKVYVAWCGFLRRKAFGAFATEDDVDIAEVGIRSALEHVKEIGQKKYGKEYKGDPHYRLERVHIKFFTQAGNVVAAREIWESLIRQQGFKYDFWYRYYIWEMVMWSNHAVRDKTNAGTELRTPQEATATIRKGLQKIEQMDWPEQLIQLFINHCEQNESIQELRSAIIETRRATKQVEMRRAREAAAAAEQQEVSQAYTDVYADAVAEEAHASGKRKREADSEATVGLTTKKSKHDIAASVEELPERSQPTVERTPPLKRDREHATIIVKKLPADATEARVRHFFRQCGTIKSVVMKPEKSDITASIEYETVDEAQYALSRRLKPFDGVQLDISLGKGSTIYVTNYPPEADEGYLRKLFQDSGEILSVRFPSLRFNTHRRFCYITFSNSDEAEAATQLDGKALGGPFNLVAKISDPNATKNREGATEEAREVYVFNMDWKASVDEIKDLFSSFGEVESVRTPKKINGQSRGIAYVVFKTKEQAAAAAAGINLKEFHGRILQAEVTQPRKVKRHAVAVISSASPGLDASPGPSTVEDGGANAISESVPNSEHHYRERSFALMNIPDTVNDARIRAIVEPYGPLKKIILMPEHAGAIVEFANVQDMGKANLALDGFEIEEGRRIAVGTVAEMKRMGAEKKKGHFVALSKKKDVTSASALMPSSLVSRPGQTSRRGGRGGLGFRRGGCGGGGTVMGCERGESANAVKPSGPAKSNADFKAMFVKGKVEQPKEDKGQDQ